MFISLRSKVISRIAEAKKAEQLETQKRVEEEKKIFEERMNKLEKEKNFILKRLNEVIEIQLATCKPLKSFIIPINDEYNTVFCYDYYAFEKIATYLGFEVTQESFFHYRELTIPEFDPKSGKEMTTVQKLIKEFNDKLNERMNDLHRMTLADCKKIQKLIKTGDFTVANTSKNEITLAYNFGRSLTDYELGIIDYYFRRKKLRFDNGPFKDCCYFTTL